MLLPSRSRPLGRATRPASGHCSSDVAAGPMSVPRYVSMEAISESAEASSAAVSGVVAAAASSGVKQPASGTHLHFVGFSLSFASASAICMTLTMTRSPSGITETHRCVYVYEWLLRASGDNPATRLSL